MELFKVSLSKCLKCGMAMQDKLNLLQKIMTYCTTKPDDSVIFDLELAEDAAKAAVFYGGQTLNRLESDGVRYFIGGDWYYDNPENRTRFRPRRIQTLTEFNIDAILDTWLAELKKTIESEVKIGIWEGCSNNSFRLAVNMEDLFGDYIQWDKALGFRRYSVEITHKVEVFANDEDDAIEQAKEIYLTELKYNKPTYYADIILN